MADDASRERYIELLKRVLTRYGFSDEDWRAIDAKEDEVEIDNIATHKDPEEADVPAEPDTDDE